MAPRPLALSAGQCRCRSLRGGGGVKLVLGTLNWVPRDVHERYWRVGLRPDGELEPSVWFTPAAAGTRSLRGKVWERQEGGPPVIFKELQHPGLDRV